MTNHKLSNFFNLVVIACCFFVSCSYPGFIVPNSPKASVETVQQSKPSEPLEPHKEETTSKLLNEIDFADAFVNDSVENSKSDTNQTTGYPAFPIPKNIVRVALLRNITQTTFDFLSSVAINRKKYSIKGKTVFKIRGNHVAVISGGKMHNVTLPCTLKVRGNGIGNIGLDGKKYRGGFVLHSEKNGRFSVINILPVEQYLRGVVPLEIGHLQANEIEALKAQAVAARTYTYKRIEERRGQFFDLSCTVSDQVYGGASAEYQESDSAVKATENLVMVYDDSLVHAYYHSTCGGKTACIEEVWDKPPHNYLKSMDDTDSLGNAYCASSRYFTWNEKWEERDFSSIVLRNLKKTYPQRKTGTKVTVFKVDSLFADGRVGMCTFGGVGWTQKVGGDKIRFILRRNGADNAILRSANFKILEHKGTISVDGKGYGHGVGMCQVGAIGKARAGFNFEQILKSYYKDISIHLSTITKR